MNAAVDLTDELPPDQQSRHVETSWQGRTATIGEVRMRRTVQISPMNARRTSKYNCQIDSNKAAHCGRSCPRPAVALGIRLQRTFERAAIAIALHQALRPDGW